MLCSCLSEDKHCNVLTDAKSTNLERERDGWLVGCLGFNGLLRQYFSLYQAVSKREGERGEKG